MPDLYCNVATCAHNKNNLCELHAIRVGEAHSFRPDSAECDSFVPGGASNSVSDYTCEVPTAVECGAKACVHNCDGCCRASSVRITGTQASCDKETCCSSFCKG